MSREPRPGVAPESLFEGRHLVLERRGGWEYVRRRHASGVVAIVALTASGEIVLVEQHRAPLDARVVELPAGLVGDLVDEADEQPLTAARRELMEETGFVSDDWTDVCEGPVSAGLTNERVRLFLARDARSEGPGGGDASEEIAVHIVPIRLAWAWLAERRSQGVLVDHKVITGVLLAGAGDLKS